MDFRELVLTRRTVHNYRSEAVAESLVEEALRLSLWAPNHRLSFPWVYSWVGPTARQELADLAVRLKSAKAELSDVKAQAVRGAVLGPAHLISLAVKRAPDAEREHEDYATLACSVQIASLFLWQNGVATKWSTGGWSTNVETYRILGLSQAEVKLEGVLMIGRAQGQPEAPQRPDLWQILRRVEG